MGLAALGVGLGDEVILAGTNWIASAASRTDLGIKPVFVDMLPWNIKEEIMEQMPFIREWGGKFLIVVPDMQAL